MTIKLYSKLGCPACDITKHRLTEWGYEFEEINVSVSKEGYDFLIENKHRTVPQIYYTDTQFVPDGATGIAVLGKDGFQRLLEQGDH